MKKQFSASAYVKVTRAARYTPLFYNKNWFHLNRIKPSLITFKCNFLIKIIHFSPIVFFCFIIWFILWLCYMYIYSYYFVNNNCNKVTQLANSKTTQFVNDWCDGWILSDSKLKTGWKEAMNIKQKIHCKMYLHCRYKY